MEGTDIKVYTHGELMPANTYPKLREHPNLVGNYGGPWQLQKMEFAMFPGAIVSGPWASLGNRPAGGGGWMSG